MKQEVWLGDCLIESTRIKDDSVDLILSDPPFGVIKGQGNSPAAKQFGFKNCNWDIPINPIDLFELALNKLRVNGRLILFSQEPYTSRLITEAVSSLPFSYRAIWEKKTTGNHLKSNKAMLNFFEDIVIFSKRNDTNYAHPLIPYANWMLSHIKEKPALISRGLGVGKIHFLSTKSSQLSVPRESLYRRIVEKYKLDQIDGFLSYSKLKEIDGQWKTDNPSVFNKWEGKAYKSNILQYKREFSGYHPTQKPVSLLNDIIKTFSNPDDLVLDLTAGSGSTGVSCIQTNRQFICIEKDPEYYKIAKLRIKKEINLHKYSLFGSNNAQNNII